MSLPIKEVSQINGQNGLTENLPVVDFHSKLHERNANTKAVEYVTFGFSFGLLVFFAF